MSGLDTPSRGRIEDGQHFLPVRVYFEDTDVTGVVYHANYLRYCERARTDFLALLGIDHSALMLPSGENISFAVTKFTIDYLRPGYLDDALVIVTGLARVGGASLDMDQRVERDGELIAIARLTVATLGPDGRPKRLPSMVRDGLSGLLSVKTVEV